MSWASQIRSWPARAGKAAKRVFSAALTGVQNLPTGDRTLTILLLTALVAPLLTSGFLALGEQIVSIGQETGGMVSSWMNPPRATIDQPTAPLPLDSLEIRLENMAESDLEGVLIRIDRQEKRASEWGAEVRTTSDGVHLRMPRLTLEWGEKAGQVTQVSVGLKGRELANEHLPLSVKPMLSVEGESGKQTRRHGIAGLAFKIGASPFRIAVPPLVREHPDWFSLEVDGKRADVPTSANWEIHPRDDEPWSRPGPHRVELSAGSQVLHHLTLTRQFEPFLELGPSGDPWTAASLPQPKPEFWEDLGPNSVRAKAGAGSFKHYILAFSHLNIQSGFEAYSTSVDVAHARDGSISLKFPGVETPTPNGSSKDEMSFKFAGWLNPEDLGEAHNDQAPSHEVSFPLNGLDLDDGLFHNLKLGLVLLKTGPANTLAKIEFWIDGRSIGNHSVVVDAIPSSIFPTLIHRGAEGADFKNMRFGSEQDV